MVVQWCPTDKMCSDYLTKPMCGEKFRHFRQKIMNLKPGKLDTLTPTVKKGKNPDSEEIVEKNMIICIKIASRGVSEASRGDLWRLIASRGISSRRLVASCSVSWRLLASRGRPQFCRGSRRGSPDM